MCSKELQEDLITLSTYIEQLDISGNTVLVTGTTGLIGSLIVKAFITFNQRHSNKIKVIGMARDRQKVREVYKDFLKERDTITDVDFVYQDVCSAISDEVTCDYIIHTANPTSSKFFITNPVEVIECIYTGTRQILEYARCNKIKGVVYLSSMEVFGYVKNTERITEQELGYLDIQNVRSSYSESKRLAECMCKSYAKEYGVPVKIARLSQTFGAGVSSFENRVFAQFARSAIRGEAIILHTLGKSVGNYCYTTDAIRAILLLLTKGEDGEAYTVVNEETTMSIAEMANLVADNFSGGKSKVVFNILDNDLCGYAPDTEMRLSSKKMRRLGWKPRVGLVEAYRRMLPDLF